MVMGTTLDDNSNKDVYLQDWWLFRSEIEFQGKRLAVGGLTAEHPMRLFSSAPVIKRLDLFTLETADGITVLIKGPVNRSRMHENGFSTEVCNHFLLGFPYYWEDFDDQHFKKEFTRGGSSRTASGPSNKQDNREHFSSDGHENSVQRGEFKVIQGYSCKEMGIHKHEDKVVETMNPVNFSERKSKDYSFEEMGIHKHEDNLIETMNPVNSSERKSKDYFFKEMGIHKHEDNVVKTTNPVNSSGRKTKDYSFKEKYDPLKDHSLLNDSNVKSITPFEVNISIAKRTRGHQRLSNMRENLSNRVKAICSSSKRLNAQDCSNDLVTPFEKNFHGIGSLGLSNIDIEGVARKPQAVENPAHGCASNESERRKSKEIVCSLRPRRSSRLNDLKNTINMLENESNKVKNVSFDSDVPNSVGVTDSGKSGCGIAVDFSFTQSQKTICESLVNGDDVGSQHGRQSSSLSSSISTCNGAIQKHNSESAMNVTESSKQREPCRFSIRPDDSNSKNNVKISVEGEETHNTERGLSQKRTKKKLKGVTDATTPKRTRSSSKNICSVSPVSLSYKRSRSGRLLVPPLDFWCNEQVVYNMDGQITGVMPVVESRTGSAFEALRKKKKFI